MPGDSLADWEKSGLKVVVRQTIDNLGGWDVAEGVAGHGRGHLHGFTNVHASAFLRIDDAVRLDRAAVQVGHRPLIVGLMARQVGYVAVPVPTGGECLSRAMAETVRACAEAAALQLEAAADGALTDAERAGIGGPLDALIAAAMEARAVLAGPKLASFPGFGKVARP
ncbi:MULTISPECIES: phage regulatory CII family protein [Roseomonadaceae]|uniref:Uncharacterized protein n=1 Tax=Falsiroseomonas oleicola TaxID=2801474 RepID=A0ABS6H5L9_9PROT|nr:phage regulatory CII family protein [Roseomonas oleicola]MBU8543980.1 hypothetical protein [Roseomonas oleicola]